MPGPGAAASLGAGLSSPDEPLARLERLVEELRAADDPETAIDLLSRISEAAREAEAVLERARREAGANA